MSRRRIVIDARAFSHPQVGGFRTYTRALIQGLAEGEGEDDILLYLDRPLPPTTPPLPPHITCRVLHTDRIRTDLARFRQQVRRDRPDLVHGALNYLPPGLGVPSTVTIHDALEIRRYPFVPLPRSLRGRLMRAYSAAFTRWSVRAARRVVTVSEASAGEIHGALGVDRGKIAVVHNGILLPPLAAPVSRSTDCVLALASTDPRKNFDLLLRALSSERERFSCPPRVQVICTNAASAAYTEAAVRRFGIEGVILLRSLSDEAMRARFAEAAVFVFPSRMEGFGLPPLEAMAAGCPVVSSSAPPMPEILGDAPLWFDPDRPDQLADALNRVLTDAPLRASLEARGREQAAPFTCRRMAEATRRVWEDAL